MAAAAMARAKPQPMPNALRSLGGAFTRFVLEPFFRLIGGKSRIWPPSRTSAPALCAIWALMMAFLLKHMREKKHRAIDDVQGRRRRLALETLDSILKNEEERTAGAEDEEAEKEGTDEEKAARRKAILADASPEVLAAVESIKKGAAKLSMLPDGNPIRAWFESNLAQGEKGVAEIIKGVLKSPRTKEVAGKGDDFKAEVGKVLGASPDYGELLRAQFPVAEPKPPMSDADRKAILDSASPEVKDAVEGVKRSAAKLSMLPHGNPIRGWFEGCLAKGQEGVREVINGVLMSPRTKEVAGKDDSFKAEVAKVLEASNYGELVRAQFRRPEDLSYDGDQTLHPLHAAAYEGRLADMDAQLRAKQATGTLAAGTCQAVSHPP